MNREITTKVNCIESSCRKHRFYLSKRWSSLGPFGLFICQNPSTANELTIDPTVMNCNNLAVHWGWSGFAIVNLFSIRAPDLDHSILKPWNVHDSKAHVHDAISAADLVVIAAGARFCKTPEYTNIVKISKKVKETVFCIKNNKDGGALHPSRPIKVSDYPSPQELS